jgi:hypothetical protein
MSSVNVDIHAAISKSVERLEISYVLENRSSEDVYILDALFRMEHGAIVLDPSLAYTIVENDLLVLFRGVVRIPHGIQVEIPEMPLARLLKAGQKAKGEIISPLPLHYHNPYHWPEGEKTLYTRRICVRIGYVPAGGIQAPPQARKVNSTNLYRLSYREVVEGQNFSETGIQATDVHILQQP